MKKVLEKEFKKLRKKEEKLLNKKDGFIKGKLSPLTKKIEDKIPRKVENTLEAAFYNGFKMVLEKGSKHIERSYNKEDIEIEHEVNDFAMRKKISKKAIKNMDKQSKKSRLVNKGVSTVEGAGFGLLGIGLPDIPLFLGVILKTVFEIALSYGFDYNKREERIYMLTLISSALCDEKYIKDLNIKLDLLGEKIDSNEEIEVNMEEAIKETSKILSDSLLLSKFIQGLPIVGVLGGVTNYNVINKVSAFALVKYKKRYLSKKK